MQPGDFDSRIPAAIMSGGQHDFKSRARRVLEIEAKAITGLVPRLDASFDRACQLCLDCRGRIIVTGMGKSGHVAGKIAATLASTGSPAFFVHPGEASHGDLGMITRIDLVIAISNSGETAEIVTILPLLKRLGIPLITLSGNQRSTLATAATVALDVGVSEEACPLNLAPTASTTAALALGDALAVALLDERGFGPEDFARSHPGGTLGRRLLTHVRDVMREAPPAVPPEAPVATAILEISRGGIGMTTVVSANKQVIGIFTDGDIRRAFEKNIDLRTLKVADVMTRNPRTIGPDKLAVEAVEMMEQFRVNALPVTDADGGLVGALNMHDLFRAKVI